MKNKKREVEVELQIIEIEPEGIHLYVNGKVEKEPIFFVLDTGASKTTLDKNFVLKNLSEIKLHANEKPAIGMGSNQIQSEFMHVPSLKIGEWKIKNWLVAVMDLSIINEAYKMVNGPEIHGILGSDLLVEGSANIDFKKKRLVLKMK